MNSALPETFDRPRKLVSIICSEKFNLIIIKVAKNCLIGINKQNGQFVKAIFRCVSTHYAFLLSQSPAFSMRRYKWLEKLKYINSRKFISETAEKNCTTL